MARIRIIDSRNKISETWEFAPAEKKVPEKMKDFEIWIGNYHLGQGYTPPREPQKVATVYALTFKSACYKYELNQKLVSIAEQELAGYVDKGTYGWYYDPERMYNSWTGQYFQTREEAQKTFTP